MQIGHGLFVDRPKIRKQHGPEYGIQQDIIKFLQLRGWHVERLIGVAWQSGLPDLFICHKQYGCRFVEVKFEDKYGFTKAQKCKFPKLMANGCGIWVLTEASEDQHDRLFKEPNLWDYLKLEDCPSDADIERWLREIEDEAM